MTLTYTEQGVAGLLTARKTRSCRGPKCQNTVTGKAEYCGQSCRNNSHALHRVADLLAGMTDQQVIEILRSYRTYKRVYDEQL